MDKLRRFSKCIKWIYGVDTEAIRLIARSRKWTQALTLYDRLKTLGKWRPFEENATRNTAGSRQS